MVTFSENVLSRVTELRHKIRKISLTSARVINFDTRDPFASCRSPESVTNISNLSVTSCHQQIWSPTSVTNINVIVLVTCLKSVNCGKGNFRNYGFYSSCHMWSGKFWKSRKISKMSVSLANIGLLQIPNWSIWIYFDPFNPEKWSSSSIVRKNTGSEI